jgi:DNA-binding transcriptional MocR family regulator
MRDLLSGLVDIQLQPQGGAPLTRQLYECLQGAILAGSLPSGHRLPSSRDMARHLKVSRNTVSFVIDQLTMEGYLDVSRGRCWQKPRCFEAKPQFREPAPALLRAGRRVCAVPNGPSWMKAGQGRFFPALPTRVNFPTTYGRVVCDALRATRSLISPRH